MFNNQSLKADISPLLIERFYKKFKDPIEQSFFEAAPTQLSVANLGEADVYGAEVEFRQNLGFLSAGLENLRFSINASVTESELTMSQGEFDSRVANARDGETIDRKRNLQGQSPFLINTSLNKEQNHGKNHIVLLFFNILPFIPNDCIIM